jgi:hypothetical protein
METQMIKNLIDKSLIEELSAQEMSIVLDAIKLDKELQAYYSETLALKKQLEKIAETNAYTETELNQARTHLFRSIDGLGKQFSLWQLAAVACLSMITGVAAMMFYMSSESSRHDSSEKLNLPQGSMLSFDVKDLGNSNVELEGKTVSNFKLVGDIKSEKIQNMLLNTVKDNGNLANRLTAFEYLDASSKNPEIQKVLINLALYEKNQTLKLEAIRTLKSYSFNSEIEQMVTQILKLDKNVSVRIAALELIVSSQQKEKLRLLYEKLKNENVDQAVLNNILLKLMEN